MKAFWWFDENRIAGMARPGFNHGHWFDLPFDEAIVMGWLGQYGTGTAPLSSFQQHLKTYGPKVAKFYPLEEAEKSRMLQALEDPSLLQSALERLGPRSRFYKKAHLEGEHVRFEQDREQLLAEVEALRAHGIRRIVSLTEEHHTRDDLAAHFGVHHISIEDMGAPNRAQAEELKRILIDAEAAHEPVAVHCLAGIGRTSTMIVAAEMLRGKPFRSLREQIQRTNPAFSCVGVQGAFLEALAAELEKKAP